MTTIRYFENQRLPDLRLEASYRPSGLGGTQLIRDGFIGPVIGEVNSGFGNVLDQVVSARYPSWTLGVVVSYPLGRSYEDAGLALAQVLRKQAAAQTASIETQAIEEVRRAARQVDATSERVGAARAGQDLASQRLDAEQKRFEVGMSTSFLVTQAQRDLLQSQVTLLQAVLDYQVAQVAFETLQQAPTLVSGRAGLLGNTVVPLPPAAPRGVSRQGGVAIF